MTLDTVAVDTCAKAAMSYMLILFSEFVFMCNQTQILKIM